MEIDAVTTQAATASLSGRQLGSYELGALLAFGGMGEVYAAHDPRLKRDVAIKVIPEALASDPVRLQRFQREARAAAAINHPNILAVHDVGTDNGIPYIVMERVPGETLAARLKRGRVPLDEGLAIATQIADALAAVHAQGILHRDLKPANVMVLPDGRVKVLDFGLAKIWSNDATGQTTTDSSYSTSPGQLFGTPLYMAPEEIHGRSSDPRADLYSLGVILFELTTGQRPFKAGDFMSAALDKLQNPAPAASDVEPTVPLALSDLIARCLAVEPEQRPASAAELKTSLEETRATLRPASRWQPLRLRARRAIRVATAPRRRVLTFSAAVAIVVAVGLAGYTTLRRPPLFPAGEHPVIVVTPFENRTGDAMNAYLGVGFADALTTALSKLSSVTVVSRDVAQASLPANADAAAIGRELGAQLVVQGTLQKAGAQLRVDARIVKADGAVLWAGEAEAPAADLFAIQRQLADRVTQALRAPRAEQQLAQRAPTTNQKALEEYWRGMALHEQTGTAAVGEAVASFERAIALDPAFALAHAGLSAALVQQYNLSRDAGDMARAERAAVTALKLEPAEIQAHLSLATIYRGTGRNGSAVEELQRVLQSEPTNDEARRRLGQIFQQEQRPDDALQQYVAAVNQRPTYWLNYDYLGRFYLTTGRAGNAVDHVYPPRRASTRSGNGVSAFGNGLSGGR